MSLTAPQQLGLKNSSLLLCNLSVYLGPQRQTSKMAKTRKAIGPPRYSKFILIAEGALIVATSDLFLFVSHVAENRVSAMEIVDELERRGTRCWIAPRDVRPGEPFDDEIA